MSLPVRHSHENGVVHFVASGSMHQGETFHIWKHIQDIAHQYQAKRVLIEYSASCERISMEHCFDLIEQIPVMSRHLACKIALFEQHMSEEARELLKFIEASVTERGAHLKLFCKLEEAHLWLREEASHIG